MTRFRFIAPFMDLVPYRNAPLLAPLLPAGRARLLDLGGGTGRVSRHFRDRFDRVILLDPQPAMLRRARRKGLGFDLVLGDARALPFKPGTVDAVLATDAFHHIPEPGRVLDEARRVVAPEGALLVEEFDPRNAQGKAIELLERMALFGSHFHTPEDLRARVEAAGFRAEAHRLNARDYVVRGEPADSAPSGGAIQKA